MTGPTSRHNRPAEVVMTGPDRSSLGLPVKPAMTEQNASNERTNRHK